MHKFLLSLTLVTTFLSIPAWAVTTITYPAKCITATVPGEQFHLHGTIVQAKMDGIKYLAIVLEPFCLGGSTEDVVRSVAVSEGSENVDPSKEPVTSKWVGHYVDLTVTMDSADGFAIDKITDIREN